MSRFVDRKDMIKTVTAHVFGTLFYGSAVWLNELTKSVHWRIINSVHYRAVRLAIGDIRNKLPRLSVDRVSKRLSPHQWMLYSNAKMPINLINLEHMILDYPKL